MNKIIQRIADLENLYLAWEKAKYIYDMHDTLYDYISVSEFEANLDNNLKDINQKILNNLFEISPIRPIIYPKSADDKGPRNRQMFWIEPQDQVVWIAVTNILGPYIDYKIPFWSYGNRLYTSIFYEKKYVDDNIKFDIKFGPYRNTCKHIYRKWQQSWPSFRRHIGITSKIMAYNEKYIEELDDKEEELINQNIHLPSHLKVKYFENDYWSGKLSGNVYWASVDFEKFFQNVKQKSILNNFTKYLDGDILSDDLINLLTKLLKFPILHDDYIDSELSNIGLTSNKKHFDNIPTGLFVAGFLANISLLELDKKITFELDHNKNISLFRFVDDHIILSDDFELLIKFISFFTEEIKSNDSGIKINNEKIEPESLRNFLAEINETTGHSYEVLKEKAIKATKLDMNFPSPFLSQTLLKFSLINQINFDILSRKDQENLIQDVIHLLVTSFPDQEIRKDTRIAFTANKLIDFIPKIHYSVDDILELECKIISLEKKIKKLSNSNETDENIKNNLIKKISILNEELSILVSDVTKIKTNFLAIKKTKCDKIFKLLIKSIDENYSKIKLWYKLIEYSFNTCENYYGEIFDKVFDLEKQNKINSFSLSYIYAFLVQSITKLIIKAFSIITHPDYIYDPQEKAIIFLNNLIEEKFLDQLFCQYRKMDKFYINLSLFSLKLILGSVMDYVISQKNIATNLSFQKYNDMVIKYELFDFEKFDLINKSKNVPEDLFYYIVNNTNKYHLLSSNYFWVKIVNNYAKYKYNLSHPFYKLYPKLLPKSISPFFKEICTNTDIEKIWQIEVFGLSHSEPKQFISLFDWIEWTKNKYNETYANNEVNFDPRTSEWTALLIIKKIATTFSKLRYISYNPYDYWVPKNWIFNYNNNSWVNIKKVINMKAIYFKDVGKIIDTPENDYENIVNLGILLISLLSKNFDLSPFVNKHYSFYRWYDLSRYIISNNPISSHTLNILKSCFSVRNRETSQILKYYSDFKFDDDTKFDCSKISNIDDLINLILIAIKELEKYHLIIENNQPREIIPISLIQLTNTSNPYTYVEEDDV